MIILFNENMFNFQSYIKIVKTKLERGESISTVALLRGKVYVDSNLRPIGLEIETLGVLEHSEERLQRIVLPDNDFVEGHVTNRDIKNLTIMFDDEGRINQSINATFNLDVYDDTNILHGIEIFSEIEHSPWKIND